MTLFNFMRLRTGGNRADYAAMGRRELALYAQGARCGAAESETIPFGALGAHADIAAENARSDYRNRFEVQCFAFGYYDAIDAIQTRGETLPDEIQAWELPEAAS